jgi:hypothetical protein
MRDHRECFLATVLTIQLFFGQLDLRQLPRMSNLTSRNFAKDAVHHLRHFLCVDVRVLVLMVLHDGAAAQHNRNVELGSSSS